MTPPRRSDTHWHAKGPRRAAADRAGLRPLEWSQLEQLADAGGAWLTAKATAPAGSDLSGQRASVGLRNLRARGLAFYEQDPWTHEGRWHITEEGYQLVMETRR